MKNLFGQIKAELLAKEQDHKVDLVDKINANIDPPERLTPDDVYVRAMYIVSDEINSYGGRFPSDEHQQLIEMLIDSPVMVGHRKDALPIARNFHAEAVEKDGINWVKVYFYWLKTAENGEDLRRNIDGGIYKEVSISFIFNFPECSICGADIRECNHRVFKEYDKNGKPETAHFNYRQVLKVLETSLVYRGSVKNTSITKELLFNGKPNESNPAANVFRPTISLWDLGGLSRDHTYIVMPAYESLRVTIRSVDSLLTMYDSSGVEIDSDRVRSLLNKLELPKGDFTLDCRLLGLQGRNRQKTSEICGYLAGHNSKVTRLMLKIASCQADEPDDTERITEILTPLMIGRMKATGNNLRSVVDRMSSRVGVELIDEDTGERYLHQPKKVISIDIIRAEKAARGFIHQYSCYTDSDTLCGQVCLEREYKTGTRLEIEINRARINNNRLEFNLRSIIDIYPSRYDDTRLRLANLPNPALEDNNLLQVYDLGNDESLVNIRFRDESYNFRVKRFSQNLFNRGRRFLAEQSDIEIPELNAIFITPIASLSKSGNTLSLKAGDSSGKTILICPAVINKTEKYLFYQAS